MQQVNPPNEQSRPWAAAVGITLLLTLAAAYFAITVLQVRTNVLAEVHSAVYGLLGLLVVLDVYVIFQQVQNHRIHLELRERLELSRLIGENAADMIAVVDADGRRLYNSPSYQKVLGYSAEELGSTESFEQIHPDDRQRVKEAAQQAKQTGQGRTLEYRFRHKNGTWRILESTASVIRGSRGKPEKMVIVNRDITERREAEKALRESELRQAQKMEAVGRLSAGVAHDFNNLLGVMIGYADVMEMRLPEGDPLRRNVEEIRKTGERAASLTRQLLTFSRRQLIEPKILDLNAVVADMEKMLRRLIGEDVELTTVLAPALRPVMADGGQIEQVIMNLAANARDAMPHGGKLTIETANVELDETSVRHLPSARPGTYAMLAVSDTGTGMDAETRAKIFEPFFTTKEIGKGTGLGLATVYGVVKQSDGHIWVRSEIGQGTIFKIYFPEVHGAIPKASAEVGQSQFLSGAETLLLVEDDESLRTVTRDLLVQAGYEVLEASDGAQALEIARRYRGRPIHLLLADVVMPAMSGPTLAGELAGPHPETKVLYMSGYTDQTIVRNGIAEPGALLLEKPYTRQTLHRKVRAALDRGPGAGNGRAHDADALAALSKPQAC